MVIAVIASVAGGRADSCDTEVPSFTCEVRDPYQASGVHASLPQASAVQIWSSRSRSAAANRPAASGGGPAPQYPATVAIFMAPLPPWPVPIWLRYGRGRPA